MNVLRNSIINTYKEVNRMGNKKTTEPKVNSFMSKPPKEDNTVNDSVRLTLAIREAFGND